MNRPVATLVSDGSAESAALAAWLRGKVRGVGLVQAFDTKDVARVIAAHRVHERGVRLVALTPGDATGDVDARAALDAVHRLLADMPPIDARSLGPRRIDEALVAATPGSEAVRALARRLSPVTPSTIATPKRRGRPKGQKNPFRGVGFDVGFALLRSQERSFTERELAEETGRSQFGVHRVLIELDERGFLARSATGTALTARDALRDAVSTAWSERVGDPRDARHFVAPTGIGTDVSARALDVLRERGIDAVLAGASALIGNRRILDAGLTVYAADDASDALVASGFRPTRGARWNVRVWPILEESVLRHTVDVGGVRATHPIITRLDLLASSDAREQALGRELETG